MRMESGAFRCSRLSQLAHDERIYCMYIVRFVLFELRRLYRIKCIVLYLEEMSMIFQELKFVGKENGKWFGYEWKREIYVIFF